MKLKRSEFLYNRQDGTIKPKIPIPARVSIHVEKKFSFAPRVTVLRGDANRLRWWWYLLKLYRRRMK